MSLLFLRVNSYPTVLLTFDFLILFVPATKLLAFGCGDVGIVGAVHYGGNHALRERKGEGTIINNQHNMKCFHATTTWHAHVNTHTHTIEIDKH